MSDNLTQGHHARCAICLGQALEARDLSTRLVEVEARAESAEARVKELEGVLEGLASHVATLKPQYHDPLSLWLEKARAALTKKGGGT